MTRRSRSMQGSVGISLTEVLIAISVLAIGVLAIAQFQASSLRNTALAEDLNNVTRAVRGELEWQRQTAVQPVSDDACETVPDTFASCTVVVVPCAYILDEGATRARLSCEGPGVTIVAPSTYRVTVTAESARGQELSLSALWTGVFVDGAAGSFGREVITGE